MCATKNKKNKPKISEDRSVTNHNQYMQYWTEATRNMISSTEMYDKYLLVLSSGFLAASLNAVLNLKTKSPIPDSTLLTLASISLLGTILLTLSSFIFSLKAQEKHLEIARRYYLDDDDQAYSQDNCYDRVVGVIRISTLITFILGVVLLSIFVLNII